MLVMCFTLSRSPPPSCSTLVARSWHAFGAYPRWRRIAPSLITSSGGLGKRSRRLRKGAILCTGGTMEGREAIAREKECAPRASWRQGAHACGLEYTPQPRYFARRSVTAETSSAAGTWVCSCVSMSRRVTALAATSSGPMTTQTRAPSLSACLNWLLSERPW